MRSPMDDKGCAAGCATALEAPTPGEQRPTTASWILARIAWNVRTTIREPTVAIGPEALVILAAQADPAIRVDPVALVFPTTPA
jgi:hypothetical protein